MDKEMRQKFWDTLCSFEGKEPASDMKKLSETIKYPKFLYRYRAVSNNTIVALQENKVYFSSADSYDDPFDTYLRIDWNKIKSMIASLNIKSEDAYERFIIPLKNHNILTGLDDQELKKKFEKLSEEDLLCYIVDVLSKYIRPMMQKNSHSICFSQDYNNENLWLKYANNHKGFCLVFDMEDNDSWLCARENKCKNCIITNSTKTLYPIYYSDEKYDATNYAIKQLIFSGIINIFKDKELAQKFVDENPEIWEREKVSLIKHKCHEYDKEWRMILGNTPNERALLKWRPYGVVLGLRISVIDEKLVIAAAQRAGIKHFFRSCINLLDNLDVREMTEMEINKILED